MQLDEKDKQIMYELDLNARLATTALAKHIGLSQEATHYRIKQLEKRGYIRKYMTFIDTAKLGYTAFIVLAKFHNVNQEEQKAVFTRLSDEKHTSWVADYFGRYDLVFTLLCKNVIEFNEEFTRIVTAYKDVLKDFLVESTVTLTQFPRKYLLEKKETKKQEPYFGRKEEKIELDTIDKKILRELSQNARKPTLAIAQDIKEPLTTVRNRIKLLEKKGIIQGYGAHIDTTKFGVYTYKAWLTTQSLTEQMKRKLQEYCRVHPNIIFFVEVVGKWNFEINYETQDLKKLREYIVDLRTNFSDIILDIETTTVFDVYIKYNQCPANL